MLYDGVQLAEVGYRIDIPVSGERIVEVKAVEALHPLYQAQLLSYLKLSDKRLGLLINFKALLREDIRCVANDFGSLLTPAAHAPAASNAARPRADA